MYKVCRINFWNFISLIRVSNILYDCGKDMAQKYNLHHWDNSHFKNLIIVFLCVLKNRIYLVSNEKRQMVATFQTRQNDTVMRFEKLATSPKFAGKGIGSFCIDYIETLAKESKCDKICLEVYEPSQHAIRFYEHRGYQIRGSVKTLKYSEMKMEKHI